MPGRAPPRGLADPVLWAAYEASQMKARRETVKGRAFGNVQPSTRMTLDRNASLAVMATVGVCVLFRGDFGPLEATARAEGPATAAPSAPSATYACEVKGTPLMAKGASLWANAQASSAVGSFAGQPIGVTATSFSAAGRVKVRTSGG